MHTVGQLAVRVKSLEPADSLGKAAEAVRASTVGAVPVVQFGTLLGLVTSEGLAAILRENGALPPDGHKVSDVFLAPAPILPESMSAREALLFLEANGLERAPVTDADSGLVGLVTKAELVSAVCGRIRPPVIGGMATPFGVYLTGGGVRGGVSDWALMTTGLYMCLVMVGAAYAALWLLGSGGVAYSRPEVARALSYLPAGFDVVNVASLLLFGLFFRLSWITGFHAAEHQVVHTIEAGDELVPEVVRKKPRVHPRCGTNLVAAATILGLFWDNSAYLGSLGMIAGVVVTFALWRRVGGWLQQHVTTRPASPKQIESGIKAGQELMARYQGHHAPPRGMLTRVWNMGLLQVLGGWILGLGVLWLVQTTLPHLPQLVDFTKLQ
jgi:CBS domain-containing protein